MTVLGGALLPFSGRVFRRGFNTSKMKKTNKLSWFESAYRFRSSEYVGTFYEKGKAADARRPHRYVSQFPSAIINFFFYQPGMYQIWLPDQRHNHRRPGHFSVIQLQLLLVKFNVFHLFGLYCFSAGTFCHLQVQLKLHHKLSRVVCILGRYSECDVSSWLQFWLKTINMIN